MRHAESAPGQDFGSTIAAGSVRLLARATVLDRPPSPPWRTQQRVDPVEGRPRRSRASWPGYGGLPVEPDRSAETDPETLERRSAALGSLVGRQGDISAVSELVGGLPLVTLTGPPGVGKTRLALEVTRGLASGLGGHCFVDLSGVSDPTGVAVAVADSLLVRWPVGQSLLDTVAAELAERRLLLVLDNCDRVVEACAELVDRLVEACAGVRVLVTSRQRLGIAAERVWVVSPLPVPPHSPALEEVSEFEAVQLFCQRAARARADFALHKANAPAVAEICRRLDGIPLAIELAAALVEVSQPSVIVEGLDQRFVMLRDGGSGAPTRHQTLVSAIDWSYGLLEPPEQSLLRRLAVFAGASTADAVAEVCPGDDITPAAVPQLLRRLVERSLVVEEPGEPELRYRLLESIRSFACERLDESDEANQLRSRHLRWCRALAEANEPAMVSGAAPDWLIKEADNFRAALNWATSSGESESAMAVAHTYMVVCRRARRYGEARHWVERAASLPTPTARGEELQIDLLLDDAGLALVAGEMHLARARCEQALALLGEGGDVAERSAALTLLGFASMFVGDPDAALAILEEAVALARASDDAATLDGALAASGRAHLMVADVATARNQFEESVSVARRGGAPIAMAKAHIGLGWADVMQGAYGPAEAHLGEALAIAERRSANFLRAVAFRWLGESARLRGDQDSARANYEACLEVARAIEAPYPSAHALLGLGRLAAEEGDFDHASAFLDEALRLARRSANGYLSGACLEALGEVAAAAGEAAQAKVLLGEALAVARERRDRLVEAAALYQLGRLARTEGDRKQSESTHRQALVLRGEIGDQAGIADSLEALAGLAGEAGQHSRALRLFGAAQALRDRQGYPRAAQEGDRYEADLATARALVNPSQFERWWAEGAELSVEGAVAYANRGRGRRRSTRPTEGWEALTPAERRVAELVAEGLTNAEIARQLDVSPRTIQGHIQHAFAKLGVATRAAVAKEVHRK